MRNKDIEQYNDKDQQHGYWELYYYTGDLFYKCFYHNGKEVGYEEQYFNNSDDNSGKLREKIYHI